MIFLITLLREIPKSKTKCVSLISISKLKTKVNKKLVTSQRQAVIKILEMEDKDKCLISNWRPIPLLNVDYKIISKIFASRLKKVLSNLISSQQTVYVA